MYRQLNFKTTFIVLLFFICTVFSQNNLWGVAWTLKEYFGKNNESIQAPNTNYTIIFRSSGAAVIKADCNNCTASYYANQDTLNIEALDLTTGTCSNYQCATSTIKNEYIAKLDSVQFYQILGNSLTLLNKEKKKVLVFTNLQLSKFDSDLKKEWNLSQIRLRGNQRLLPDNGYNLKFLQNNLVTYNLDCNTCQGTYTQNDSVLSIQKGSCTEAVCSQSSVSTKLIQAFSRPFYYSITANTSLNQNNLYLLFNNRQDTLFYVAQGNGTTALNKKEGINWSEQLTIDLNKKKQLNLYIHNKIASGKIGVYRIDGHLVYLGDIKSKIQINIHLPSGVYYLKIISIHSEFIQKILIQ